MRNIAMVVSYDGTAYEGYQSQPSRNTIQDKLEAAVKLLTGEQVKVHGSGRTDAGVHARGQVVHFHTESRIPTQRWGQAMNARLPKDIVVSFAREVPENFHARRSALRKTYRYTIHNSSVPDVMLRSTSLHIYRPLVIEAMRAGLAHLEGVHDFTSFSSVRTDKTIRIRTLYEATLDVLPNSEGCGQIITISLTGNGFLYNMVRIIVGTLLWVGRERIEPDEMRSILEAKDRGRAGPTALPHGLKLWDVTYPEFSSGDVFNIV